MPCVSVTTTLRTRAASAGRERVEQRKCLGQAAEQREMRVVALSSPAPRMADAISESASGVAPPSTCARKSSSRRSRSSGSEQGRVGDGIRRPCQQVRQPDGLPQSGGQHPNREVERARDTPERVSSAGGDARCPRLAGVL